MAARALCLLLVLLAAGCIGPPAHEPPTTQGDPGRVTVVLVTGEVESYGPDPEEMSACDWMRSHRYDIETEEIRYAGDRPLRPGETLVVVLYDGTFDDPYALGCGAFWGLTAINPDEPLEVRLDATEFSKAYPFQLTGGDLRFPQATLRPFNHLDLHIDETQVDHRYEGDIRITHLGHWHWRGIREVGWEDL